MPLPSSCKMDQHRDVPTNAVFKTDTESSCATRQKSKHNLSINNKQLLVKYFLVEINFIIKAYMNI